MDEEARALVKRLLEEGKRYDDVRRALISHGYTTEGFENEYPEIQKEIGITEPPPTKVTPEPIQTVLNEDAKLYSDRHEKLNISNLFRNIIKLLAGLLVVVVAGIVLSGYGGTIVEKYFGSDTDINSINAEDVLHQTNLETMQFSAESYRSKLFDYEGLCESIGIDKNVYSCAASAETYAIESSLTSGKYYCVDSTGFSGIIESSVDGRMSCNK